MNRDSGGTAVIIGASSGIGEALARQLNREGWRLGLLARRLDRLEALRETLAPGTIVRRIDVTHDDAAAIFEWLQNVRSAIRRAIIDNDNFFERICLIKDGIKAALNEASAVVGNDRYRDLIATRHEPSSNSPTLSIQ